jgi:hypothetical protein
MHFYKLKQRDENIEKDEMKGLDVLWSQSFI